MSHRLFLLFYPLFSLLFYTATMYGMDKSPRRLFLLFHFSTVFDFPVDLEDLHINLKSYGLSAKKCMKSSLFSMGVVFGRPRFFLEPILVFISNIDGPLEDRNFSTA